MKFRPGQSFGLPPPVSLDLPVLLRAIAAARTQLAELKDESAAVPNSWLPRSPALARESVVSSETERIRTTMESVSQQALFPGVERRAADKRVLRNGEAVRWSIT